MTNVFVAIYEHRRGTDVNVFATEAGALAWKDELARDYWSSYCEGEPPSEGAGDAYFEAAGEYSYGEFFSLEEHLILDHQLARPKSQPSIQGVAMTNFYRFTMDSEDEGSRSFVYEAEDDVEAQKVANRISAEFGDEWSLREWAPLYLDGYMELCTY